MGNLVHRSKRFLLTLAGVAVLAGGPAAVVASAVPNDGGTSGYDCANGKRWFDQRVADYKALKDSNPSAAAIAKRDAQYEKDAATKAGCDTSGWTVPLVRTSSGDYGIVTGTYGALPTAGGGSTVGSVTGAAPSGRVLAP